MPQLDPTHYPTQLFWLVVTFAVLYYAMVRFAIPRISEVLEERRDRIEGNLDRAEALKKEAELALAAYEDAMIKAREEAQAVIKETVGEVSAEASKRHAALSKRLDSEAEAAEERIGKAKDNALADIGVISAEIAGQTASKLIGVTSLDKKSVKAAVKAVMKEES